MANNKYREIEQREGRPMPDVLIDLYEQYGHEPNPQAIVAEQLGISQPTLSQWIKYLRLVRKTTLSRPPKTPEGGHTQPHLS